MDGMRGGKGAVRKIDLDAFFQFAEDITPFLFPGFGLVGPQHLPEIPLAKYRAPFHTLLQPACPSGFFLVGCEDLHRIMTHAHASGRAKNRAPFHAAQGLLHSPGFGVDPMRRIHQGIARHGRLAKDRPPYLIRRNEPSTGALPSNTILRFQKASYTYHFSQSKDIPYALRGSFIGILGGPFDLVFASRPSHGGGFAFQSTAELSTSIRPGGRSTLATLNVLQSRLSLLYDQGSCQFDQVFGQPFPLLLREHGRVVPR